MKNSATQKLAERILRIADELQAVDPVVIDVRNRSSIADIYLVAGANSIPHLASLGEGIRSRLKGDGIACLAADTDPQSGWIVLDYLDIVVHLMLTEQRLYYALEDLWRVKEPLVVRKRHQDGDRDTPGFPPPGRAGSNAPADPER